MGEVSAEEQEVRVGDVVQISPEARNKMFAGCMVTVTEVLPWAVMGYVQALGENGEPGDLAYIRLLHEEYEFVGTAAWIVAN